MTAWSVSSPDNGVSGHDELRMTTRRVLEQLALGLHKDVVTGCQLHAIDAAQVGTNVTHCNVSTHTHTHHTHTHTYTRVALLLPVFNYQYFKSLLHLRHSPSPIHSAAAAVTGT